MFLPPQSARMGAGLCRGTEAPGPPLTGRMAWRLWKRPQELPGALHPQGSAFTPRPPWAVLTLMQRSRAMQPTVKRRSSRKSRNQALQCSQPLSPIMRMCSWERTRGGVRHDHLPSPASRRLLGAFCADAWCRTCTEAGRGTPGKEHMRRKARAGQRRRTGRCM